MSAKSNLIYDAWNAIVILCTSYIAIIIPLDLIFEIKSEMYTFSDQFITIIFLVDLIVNVYKYRDLKKTPNYNDSNKSTLFLKGFILTDLLAVIPFGLFFIHPFSNYLDYSNYLEL